MKAFEVGSTDKHVKYTKHFDWFFNLFSKVHMFRCGGCFGGWESRYKVG